MALCWASVLMAQQEAANWYFGANAGLSFVTGTPQPLLDGELFTFEGCATISTGEGDLLFYTDGTLVWNRIHQLMPNGFDLLGSESSTQSAMIIPRPNSNSIYYVFTADNVLNYESDGTSAGINFSVVDMQADGGLGDVTVKNTNLLANGAENLSAVRASNGVDYWVVTHHINKFYSYKVTSSGVNTTPVVSTVGPTIDNFQNIRGSIKMAPNGEKLAIAHNLFQPDIDGRLLLYDFDDSTGMVSNPIELTGAINYYGVEFSADTKRLYASGMTIVAGETDELVIEQYDVDAADIPASRYIVFSGNGGLGSTDLAGTLQLGNDRKIYHAFPGPEISVINAPNDDNSACDFRLNDVDLAGRLSRVGLPPFIQSFFETIFDIENVCFGQTTEFNLTSSEPINGIQWDFGDPASGANNTSTLMSPTHVFSSTGLFEVTIEVDFATRADKTFVEFVQISEAPIVNTPVTLVQCDIDGVDDGISQFNLTEALDQLLPNASGFSTAFYTSLSDAQNNLNEINSTNYQNTSNGQIVFARVFSNSECFSIAEVELQVDPMTFIDNYFVSVCDRAINSTSTQLVFLSDIIDILILDYPGTDFSFYTSGEDALLEMNEVLDEFEVDPNGPGLFFRAENGNACVMIGSLLFDVRESPNLSDERVFICPEEDEIELAAPEGFASYVWSTGETTSSIIVDDIGDYTVTVFNGTNCDDSKVFSVLLVPSVDEIDVEVSDFNSNPSITVLIAMSEMYQYSLNDGPLQDDPYFDGLLPGVYTIRVWKDGCLIYIRNVIVGGVPPLLTPNGDGYHDTWQVFGLDEYPQSRIFIFDRFGKLLKEMGPFSEPWEGRYQGALLPSSDYWYRINLDDGRVIKGHLTLKR